MKAFDKKRGWLIKCVGGPIAGTEIRTWNCRPDPAEEINAQHKRLTVVGNYDGWYVLQAARKKDGSLKEVKKDGRVLLDMEYVWVTIDRESTERQVA
jgi:hypothetical protein